MYKHGYVNRSVFECGTIIYVEKSYCVKLFYNLFEIQNQRLSDSYCTIHAVIGA